MKAVLGVDPVDVLQELVERVLPADTDPALQGEWTKVVQLLGSFWLALAAGVIASLALGVALEALLMKRLYERSHLDQVLLHTC